MVWVGWQRKRGWNPSAGRAGEVNDDTAVAVSVSTITSMTPATSSMPAAVPICLRRIARRGCAKHWIDHRSSQCSVQQQRCYRCDNFAFAHITRLYRAYP
jgi:hypothetical protein